MSQVIIKSDFLDFPLQSSDRWLDGHKFPLGLQSLDVSMVSSKKKRFRITTQHWQKNKGYQFWWNRKGALYANWSCDGSDHGEPNVDIQLHLCWVSSFFHLGRLDSNWGSLLLLCYPHNHWVRSLFLTSLCYFFFIDTSFGDYTPVASFHGFQHSVTASLKMAFTVSYCIFGKSKCWDTNQILII